MTAVRGFSVPSLRPVQQRCCEFWLGARREHGEYPLWSLTDEQQKYPAKIRATRWVRAAPSPRRVAGSVNRTSSICLAAVSRVTRGHSQPYYTFLTLGA